MSPQKLNCLAGDRSPESLPGRDHENLIDPGFIYRLRLPSLRVIYIVTAIFERCATWTRRESWRASSRTIWPRYREPPNFRGLYGTDKRGSVNRRRIK